jgi:hypothetical protein
LRGFTVGGLLGLGVGFCCGLVFSSMSKKKRKPRIAAPALPAPSISLDELIAGGPPTVADDLRQNLRLKFMYDEDKVDRAIQLERERDPAAGLEELMRAAIHRWERDNS